MASARRGDRVSWAHYGGVMRTPRSASTEGFLRNFGALGVLLLAPATSATAAPLADPGPGRIP